MSARDPLRALYEATDYVVLPDGGASFALRIGEPSPEADALLEGAAVPAWAFVTAENPGSTRLAPEENAARRAVLEACVRASGLTFLRGRGVARDGSWSEESLLVLGIDGGAATDLGRRHGQRAVVTGERGGRARLAWCDPA